MLYRVTFTINIPQMLPYIVYMDPMGYITSRFGACPFFSATPQGWLGQRFVRDKIYLDEMHFRLVHGTQESQRSQA